MAPLDPEAGPVAPATTEHYFLAEGPMWDAARSRLLWVDILEGHVHSGALSPEGIITHLERIDFPDVAGTVAVAASGDLVVAGTDRLHFRDSSGVFTAGEPVVTGADRRFNDGKPDPSGRLVVGTKGPTHAEVLGRFDGAEFTILDDDLQLSNGLTWTRDGSIFYSVDTPTRRIHRRSYDAVTGIVGEREVFAELTDGYPDGITIDAEEHIWVAVWGGGCVLRLDPAGEVVARIDVPAPHTSSVAFAGPDLDIMVITTARENLSAAQLAEHPLSGRLFTLRPGVKGLPPYLWNGVR